MVMSWWESEVAKGEQRGVQQGERQRARATLLKMLRLRFGELPAAVIARIESADLPELDVWTERFVTATRLEDVLGPLSA